MIREALTVLQFASLRSILEVSFITVRKRSLRRLCFYTCLSFCLQGVGLQAHTQGRGCGVWLEGLQDYTQRVGCGTWLGEGGLQAHTRGRLGVWLVGEGGVSRPIPRVEGSGRGEGGLQAQAGGCIPACTEADTTQQTATAADGTHPTGMHSSLQWLNIVKKPP